MGRKKTGRKKKSEYRKYKKHLENKKKIENAMLMMQTVTNTALEVARIKAVSQGINNMKRETDGAVVANTENKGLIINAGESPSFCSEGISEVVLSAIMQPTKEQDNATKED